MKKILCFLLTCLFLISFTGCSQKQAAETDMTPDDMAAAIRASQKELPALVQISLKDPDFAIWLSDYYFLQTEQVTDGAICYANGVEASEIAVLLMTDERACETAKEALEEYMQNRAGAFEGYAPQQAAMVKEGMIVINGRYIALMICPEPQQAKEAFLNCFARSTEGGDSRESNAGNVDSENDGINTEEVDTSAPALETEAENLYNAEAVLQAWQSGDDSSLSEMNRRILNAAKSVLESEIDDSMSDYEKELAIHDWITGWSSFDFSVFGRSAENGFTEGSDTPYGVLIDRSAMCHGYSSTFQLFMDMLGIECITVYGLPGSNGVEHSWNMVKLDGEWYCVDCAWDDPIGGSPGHTWFNVTSDTLRSGSIHRWDESSVPEADGTAYAYGRQE